MSQQLGFVEIVVFLIRNCAVASTCTNCLLTASDCKMSHAQMLLNAARLGPMGTLALNAQDHTTMEMNVKDGLIRQVFHWIWEVERDESKRMGQNKSSCLEHGFWSYWKSLWSKWITMHPAEEWVIHRMSEIVSIVRRLQIRDGRGLKAFLRDQSLEISGPLKGGRFP